MALSRRTTNSLGGPTYIPDARVEEALATRRQDFNERQQQQLMEQAKFAQMGAAQDAHLKSQRLMLDTWKEQNAADLAAQKHDWLKKFQSGTLAQGDRGLDQDAQGMIQDMQQFAATLAQDERGLNQSWQEALLGSGDRRRGQDMTAGTADLDRQARAALSQQGMLNDAGIAGANIQSREKIASQGLEHDQQQSGQAFINSLLRDALGSQDARLLEQLKSRHRFQLAEREGKSDARQATFGAMQDLELGDMSPEDRAAALTQLQGQAAVLDPDMAQVIASMAPSMLPEGSPSNMTRFAQLAQQALGNMDNPFVPAPLRSLAGAAQGGLSALLGSPEELEARAQGEIRADTDANMAQLLQGLSNNPMVQAAQAFPGPQAPPMPQPTSLEDLLAMAQAFQQRR